MMSVTKMLMSTAIEILQNNVYPSERFTTK